MPDKIDLRKTYKEIYAAGSVPAFVSVPELAIFSVSGEGDPRGSKRFADCVEALYAASYALKMASKKSGGPDWGVLGLEGDWWCDDMAEFRMERRDIWKWELLIVQPPFATESRAGEAIDEARRKKGSQAAADLRFGRQGAHEAAQVLHAGPYDAEPPTIAALHDFIHAAGRVLAGRHRELYLSDARKTAPERLRTIIRQPVLRP